MNSLTVVDIRVFNLNSFMLRIINSGIYLEKISYNKNILRCKMYTDDVAKLQKYYKLTIVKSLNFTTIVSAIKRNLLPLISALLGLLLFLILISITVEVNIMSQNDELNKRLAKSLEEQGIKRFSFKKNINELTKIKKQLEEQYIQEIEWLEIKENGMQYIVTLEERKIATPNTEEAYCNVYATTDGIVTRIIARKGNVIASENKYVRAGDILISGDITLNEETKSQVCAKATVFGEVWYKVNLTVPKTYKEKHYTGKNQYNLLFSSGRNDYKIFKSRHKDYDVSTKELISILGKKIILTKEKEYTYTTKNYTEEELNNTVDEIITEKVNLSLAKGEKILYKNILKKSEFDSTIDIEVFVTVEKILGSNE